MTLTAGEPPPPPPSKHIIVSNNTTNISHTTTTTTTTVNFLAINNHHLYLATENQIHVIDITSFALLDTFTVSEPSSGSVKSITFSNGNIFTAHQDNKIRVWKLTEHKRHKHITTLPTLKDRLLRSTLPKNYINVRRHKKKLWIKHNDAVSGLGVITNELICSVSWDKYLKIWNTSGFRCVQSVKAHDDAINSVVVAEDGNIITGSADRKIKIWRKGVSEKYELLSTLEKHKLGVNALALNDDGSVLFSGGGDCVIIVWEKVHTSYGMVASSVLHGHCKPILCLINVCDMLFSGSADRTIRVWRQGYDEGSKFCCLKVLDGYERPVRSLVVDRDECTFEDKDRCSVRVFSESSDRVIRMFTFQGSSFSDSLYIHV